jgi:hypothetical protein
VDDAERALHEVSVMFADLSDGLGARDSTGVLETVAQVALRRLPGAAGVTVSTCDGTRFATRVSTDERAREADLLQYELGAGPAVEVLSGQSFSHVSDALGDAQRPGFGRRLAEHGYLSALSVALCDAANGPPTGLNLYAEPARAFDPVAVRMATLLAAHGGLALVQVRSTERADNLERALVSTKEIGPAIGLIMAQHHIGHDQAMSLLRKISQKVNRKVSDLSAEIVEAGALRQSTGPLT